MNDQNELVIGIDLGTTNSCAAVYTNGQIRVLDNREGHRITPSFLYITEEAPVIVGHFAKRMAERNKPEYAIYEVKRLVGRKFDDAKLKNNLQFLSYKVEKVDGKNEPIVVVQQTKEIIYKTPIQLCTLILFKIKSDVEKKLGEGQGKKAVITVPAYFNVSQREATLEAANKAGFTVLKLLNEPTAAAFKFNLENECQINDHFLVYDLGGGTFDVAILKQTLNNIEVVGVDGDSHLGGHDFDNLILDYVCQNLIEKYNFNPKCSQDKRDLLRIRSLSEMAKIELSNLDKTQVSLVGLVPNQTQVLIDITREQFEEMAHCLFKKTIEIVGNCLNSCQLTKGDIKQVILSGGSTRIPKIQKLLGDYFGDDRVNSFLHPEECVAEGAAIQAATLSTNPKQKIDVIKITDVTPLSLGVNTLASLMVLCIKKNSSIPANATIDFVTVENQQTSMLLEIYEGERTDARKNRHLGRFTICNLTPAPPGQCTILLTMNIDQNGILTVTAEEKYKNNVKSLKIAYNRGHVSDAEVKNAVKDAEDNKIEDQRFVKFAYLKEYLLKYCEAVRYNIINKNLQESNEHIYELCLNTHTEAKRLEMDDETEVKKLTVMVESECKSLVNCYCFEFMPEKKVLLDIR